MAQVFGAIYKLIFRTGVMSERHSLSHLTKEFALEKGANKLLSDDEGTSKAKDFEKALADAQRGDFSALKKFNPKLVESALIKYNVSDDVKDNILQNIQRRGRKSYDVVRCMSKENGLKNGEIYQKDTYSDMKGKQVYRSYKSSDGSLDVHMSMYYGDKYAIDSVSSRIEAPSEGETRLPDDAVSKDKGKINENERKFNDNDIVDNDGIDTNYKNNKSHLKDYKKEIKRLKKEIEEKIEADTYESIPNSSNNEVSILKFSGKRGYNSKSNVQRFKSNSLRSQSGSGSSTSEAEASWAHAQQANWSAISSGGSQRVSSQFIYDPVRGQAVERSNFMKPLNVERSTLKLKQEMVNKDITSRSVEQDELRMLNDKGIVNYKESKGDVGHAQQNEQNTSIENTTERASLRRDATKHVLEEIKTIEYIAGKGGISTVETVEDVAAMSVGGSIILDTLQEVKAAGDISTVKNTKSMEGENNQKINDKTENYEKAVYQEKELQYRNKDIDRNKDSINEHGNKDNSQKKENINNIQDEGDKLVKNVNNRIDTTRNNMCELMKNKDKEGFEKNADRCLREEHEKLGEDLKELDTLQKDGYQMDENRKGIMHKAKKIYDFLNNYIDPVNQQLKQYDPGEAIIQLLEQYSGVRVPVAEDNAKNNNQQTGNLSGDDLAKIGNKLRGKKQGKSSQGAPDHEAGSKKVGGRKRSGAAKASLSAKASVSTKAGTSTRTRTSTKAGTSAKASASAAGKEQEHGEGSEHLEHSGDHRKENIDDIQNKGDELVKKANDRINTMKNNVRELEKKKDKENFEKDTDSYLRKEHEELGEDLKELDTLQKDGYKMDENKERFIHKAKKIYDFLNNYVDPINQQLKQRDPGEAIVQLLEQYSEVRVPIAEDAKNNNQQTGYLSGDNLAKIGKKLRGKKQGNDMEKEVFVSKFEKLAIVGKRSSLPKETLSLQKEIAREKGEEMYEVAKRSGENLEEILKNIRSRKNDYRDKIDKSVRYKAEFVGSVKDMAKNDEDGLIYKEAGKHMYDALLDKVRSYEGIDAIRPMMEKGKENIRAWIDKNRDNINRDTVKEAVSAWLAEQSRERDLKVAN